MRVLILSHNVFSETNNMGKTLLSYFQDFSPEELAEFYIQEKEPKNASLSRSYYRVTDRDALKSVFGKKVGTAFYLTESAPEEAAEAGAAVEAIRQFGRQKHPIVFTLRNSIWALSHWNTKTFRDWLNGFAPDVIFFLSGDFAFMNNIALSIQAYLQKPMVVCWVDDYYFHNRNEGSALGRFEHRIYRRSVERVIEKADCILTISDPMSKAYAAQFGKPCRTLHTAAKRRASQGEGDRNSVAYFGNLDFCRCEPLTEIGQAIRDLRLDGIDGIDVYSPETRPENLRGLTEENGVHFRGRITPAEVATRTDECISIIHAEAFHDATIKMVRYSVSTKIADALLNGPCLIAYGPEGVASIDYLKEHHAAYVITKPEDLRPGLKEILTNAALREEIVKNARSLAAENHDAAVFSKKVRAWLQEAIDRAEGAE